MSRRKVTARRSPSGKIYHPKSELASPTEVKRLCDSALSGLRSAEWATSAGQAYLHGKISASEYSACRRWAEMTTAYSAATGSPKPPRTAQHDATGGTPPDPDSITGQKRARQDEQTVAAWLSGKHALRIAGPTIERVVDDVIVQGLAPVGMVEIDALRTGLQALLSSWSSRRR